jgi:hypothetical protein
MTTTYTYNLEMNLEINLGDDRYVRHTELKQ